MNDHNRLCAAGLSATLLVGLTTFSAGMEITGSEVARVGVLDGVAETEDGRIRLDIDPGSLPPRAHGSVRWRTDLPADARVAAVELIDPRLPSRQISPRRWSAWPVAVTDAITQARFLRANGRWTGWTPRNLLDGGGFVDHDGNGIPDGTQVLRLRPDDNRLFTDAPGDADADPPTNSWWASQSVVRRGDFVDAADLPPGAPSALRLRRAGTAGQDTAEMLCDLVPPGTTLTIAGWNRYDIGEETCMGVMARFHEFDAEGRRTGKYVLLGDDDFHQPSGSAPWRWRALTFTTAPETVRLGIYPVRMIRATGRAWAAAWEIREGSVFAPPGAAGTVWTASVPPDLSAWETSLPNHTDAVDDALRIRPPAGAVGVVSLRDPFPLREGILYAFRVELANDVPARYDRTHDAWVSCYLEFLDGREEVIDVAKVMAFRPDADHPLGAAMVAPPGTVSGRFRLVASHKTYADASRIDGEMTARFHALAVEESRFDPAWSPRPAGNRVPLTPPPDARAIEIRTRLLTRDPEVAPSIGGYRLIMAPPPTPEAPGSG